MREMLRRFKLGSQFTLILSLIFISGIALGGLVLSKALEQQAEMEMNYRAQIAMQMINAVRSYTNDNIAPLLARFSNPETDLIPETVPSLAAKKVFDKLKENWKYKDFIYKSATLNPTNLGDQANRFEAKLIERFESDRTLKSLSGFRFQADEQLFYSAQPLTLTNPTCLKCHSSPKAAPKSHIEKYGTQNGFGWKRNQIIGTQIIYIPASEVFNNARKALFLFLSIFIAIFALVLVLVNYLLKWRVIKPLKPMAQLAETISSDTITPNEVRTLEWEGLTKIAQRRDELGQLGRVFQKMVHEVYAREQQFSQQLQQLRVEIDQTKRVREVAEIAETDYFQNLQKNAKDIRNQWTQLGT